MEAARVMKVSKERPFRVVCKELPERLHSPGWLAGEGDEQDDDVDRPLELSAKSVNCFASGATDDAGWPQPPVAAS